MYKTSHMTLFHEKDSFWKITVSKSFLAIHTATSLLMKRVFSSLRPTKHSFCETVTLNINVKAISKANLVQWNILSCCDDLQLGVSGPFSSIIPSNMSRRVDCAVSTCSSALHNVRHISVSSPAPAYLSAIRESSAGVCCLTSTSK